MSSAFMVFLACAPSSTIARKLLEEEFTEAGCTAESLSSSEARSVGTCRLRLSHGTAYYRRTTCDDTKMWTAYYSDSACTMAITSFTGDNGNVYNLSVENEPLGCTQRGAWWRKLTCNPSAGKEGSVSFWTVDTCSGTPVDRGGFVYDFCHHSSTNSKKITISNGSLKEMYYTTIDCTGASDSQTIGSLAACNVYLTDPSKFFRITLESEGPGDSASSETTTTSEGPGGSDGADGSDNSTLVSGTSKVEMSFGLLAFLLVKMVV